MIGKAVLYDSNSHSFPSFAGPVFKPFNTRVLVRVKLKRDNHPDLKNDWSVQVRNDSTNYSVYHKTYDMDSLKSESIVVVIMCAKDQTVWVERTKKDKLKAEISLEVEYEV